MTFAKQLMKLVLGGMVVGLVISALAVAVVAFSPHATFAASAVTKTVTIVNSKKSTFAFKPATLKIKVGTTVTWKNTTSVPHTATSDDGKTFNSGTINPGGTFSFTFTTKGTFTYHCSFHPFMHGSIIVS